MSVRLVYETHSTTEDNEAGIATGWLPGQLSEEGRRQARLLGDRRRQDGVSRVITSDLARAVETAAIAFPTGMPPVSTDIRLRECDYGTLNGAPVRALLPRAAHIDVPFPGGQSYRNIVDATQSFLGDLAARHSGERVLVIGHSATRWALQVLLGGHSLQDLVDAPFEWQPGWEYDLH